MNNIECKNCESLWQIKCKDVTAELVQCPLCCKVEEPIVEGEEVVEEKQDHKSSLEIIEKLKFKKCKGCKKDLDKRNKTGFCKECLKRPAVKKKCLMCQDTFEGKDNYCKDCIKLAGAK